MTQIIEKKKSKALSKCKMLTSGNTVNGEAKGLLSK